ncbi:hypothetical protein FRX31_030871, partial [Thalictrum thalictroides]
MKQQHMSKAERAICLSPNLIEFALFFTRILIHNSEFQRALQVAENALLILHPIDPARHSWEINLLDTTETDDPQQRNEALQQSLRGIINGIRGNEQQNSNSETEDDLE